jgi:chemotaxis protein MotB
MRRHSLRAWVVSLIVIGVTGCSHFNTGTGNDSMSGLLNEMKAVPPIVASAPAKTVGQNGDEEMVRLKGLLGQQRIFKAEKDLVELLQPEISKGNVRVYQFSDQLKINLASGLLFDSGKAELKPAGVDVIKRVGSVLKEFPGKQLHVNGYTDNVPIRGALLKIFRSNMDLSKARAEYVMTTLEHGGVPKGNMTATGHADAEPVADNKTATGRQNNRRVEIVVQ